jgi:phosphoribosylamine---glycine ligase
MNILLLGSGGRENALAWKISASAKCSHLYIAPGNAGTSQYGTNVNLNVLDFRGIKSFVIENHIDLVLPGPEDPLVKGIVDFFEADPLLKNVAVIGPSKNGAQLEGSKDFSKRFMSRHNIPTAAYASFSIDTLNEGYSFIDSLKAPYVLKADGLAAGKGVLIIDDKAEAKNSLRGMLEDESFGSAGSTVVIEEFLKGIELSVFVLTDGNSYLILPEAKDYKRIGVNDTGLNTGGMGAVSPVPFADKEFMRKTEEQIIIPTIKGIKEENIPYRGFIFIGIMNVNGQPYVIEYNARLGDPETETILPRIKNDFVDLLLSVSDQNIHEIRIDTDVRTAVTIMLVSGGYPGAYAKGKKITGINECSDSYIFHAGTTAADNDILTSGGRVIAITSLAPTIKDALKVSERNAEKINFEGKYYRSDIGKDLL